ncbi:MAG: alanine racemase [Rhodospirillaceae bacterium]
MIKPEPLEATAVLTVNLGAIVANWLGLRGKLPRAECAAVVKADAYGLGAEKVAPALAAAGCVTFFVAPLDEGVVLRPLLPEAEIVALSGLVAGNEKEHVAHRVTPVLNSLEEIARWQAFAWSSGKLLPAWIHLDTGMNRLGLDTSAVLSLATQPERLDGLLLHGWMSHLACADQAGHPMSVAQLGRFHLALARLPKARRSLANSAGIFRSRALHLELVRPGAALYGINPTPTTTNPQLSVITMKGRILQVRDIDRGKGVGYGAKHKMDRPGRIATIAVGYADGCLRSQEGRGRVFIDGQPAPVVGQVSMDLITADVTELPNGAVQPGGWAELIGPHRSVDTVAEESGTIGYEILTSLSRRCRRVWLPPCEGEKWTF